MRIFVINKNVQFFEQYVKHTDVGIIYKNISNPILKALRQIHLRAKLPFFDVWYTNEFKNIGRTGCDTIILFDTILTLPAAKYIKKKYPQIRVIYWFWNHIYTEKIIKGLPNGIEKWSYDEPDCVKYGMNFNTQFCFKDYGYYEANDTRIEQDFCFIGGVKGRQEEIDNCASLIDNAGFTKKFLVIDYENKAKHQHGIPYSELIEIDKRSRCIVDIIPKAQNGISVRPLEAIMLNKKLLTNMVSMRSMNFYSPQNIYILGIDNAKTLQEFIDSPLDIQLQNNMKDYYDFNNWFSRFNKSPRKKKVLIVASVVSFIEWFNKENVEYLKDKGYEVHIACNFEYLNDTDEEKTKAYIDKIQKEGIILHNINFARSPFSVGNIICYNKLKRIIADNYFELIHTHTPTASIITRLAARKARRNKTTVMYTCHGFHFHKAAPKINWILYYPIERVMSRLCDYIVTINNEDYRRAQTFHAPNVRYIPGVGVDIKRIQDCKVDKVRYKESLGLPGNCILILSIGELIDRKNHEVIIRALARVHNPNIYYAICGKGPLKKHLEQLAKDLGIKGRVRFLGFRNDIPELCNTADISAFPSKIEGLGLAGIEAMAAGVPLISSNVHGICDYVINGKTGYAIAPEDVDGFAEAMECLANDKSLREKMAINCNVAVTPFGKSNALSAMWSIYDEILK